MTNNSYTAGRRIHAVARFSLVRDAIRLSAAVHRVNQGNHPNVPGVEHDAPENSWRPKSLADRREKKARTDRFPIGFWLKKTYVWLLFFLSCVFDKFSIHTGLVISVIFRSQWVSGFALFVTRETS